MAEKFWTCYVEGSGKLRKILDEYDTAKQQAEQLASLPENVNKDVYILEATQVCRVSTMLVQWQIL